MMKTEPRTFDRITVDPRQMQGQPCIRGTRMTVRRVLQIISEYDDREEIFREFPELQPDDIRQSLRYASEAMHDRMVAVPPLPAREELTAPQ